MQSNDVIEVVTLLGGGINEATFAAARVWTRTKPRRAARARGTSPDLHIDTIQVRSRDFH
jgi:hypothetical protein